MSGRPSSKPDMVINKITADSSDLIGDAVEPAEKSTRGGSMAADASEPIEREQGKSHQVISTAAYYRVEGHEPDGCVYDKTLDWLEAYAETGGVR